MKEIEILEDVEHPIIGVDSSNLKLENGEDAIGLDGVQLIFTPHPM